MSAPRPGTPDYDQAVKIAANIERRIADAIRPLETEMKIMKWDSEYRNIVWEALAQTALRKMT